MLLIYLFIFLVLYPIVVQLLNSANPCGQELPWLFLQTLTAFDGFPSPLAAFSSLAMLKQNANEGCNSCAILAVLVLSFITCFILLVNEPTSEQNGSQ